MRLPSTVDRWQARHRAAHPVQFFYALGVVTVVLFLLVAQVVAKGAP